jgi:ketosteroid isomerase-like protein
MRTAIKIMALTAALTATGAAVPAAVSASDGAGHESRCVRSLEEANAAFDHAFFARDVDAFIDFYTDDATIIYFNGTRLYTKEEARQNTTALFQQEWTASFNVLKVTTQSGCHSGQVFEDGHFTRNGVTSHFFVGLSWVREHDQWRVAVDQGTGLPS